MLSHNKTKIDSFSGFTTFELIAAIFMVSVCMVAFAQLVSGTLGYRQTRQTTQAANDQLLNVLEMLDREEPERLKNLDFDKQPYEMLLANSLPGGKVAFSIKPFPDGQGENSPKDSALLEVTVNWDVGEKRPSRELILVKWVSLSEQRRSEPQQNTEEVTP